MVGFGSPEASQDSFTCLPTAETTSADVLTSDGATEHKITTFKSTEINKPIYLPHLEQHACNTNISIQNHKQN